MAAVAAGAVAARDAGDSSADPSNPVVIIDDWTDPEIPRRDNWRREILDGARFDPRRGRELPQPPERIEAQTCGVSAVWFVLPTAQAAYVEKLPGAQRVFRDARKDLWRVPGRSC